MRSIEHWYRLKYQSELKGLRITFDDVAPLIVGLQKRFKKQIEGESENKTPIYKIAIGNGSKRVLIWSQMHGNESTGTKVIFDLFKFFNTENEFNELKNKILNNCTLLFIPLLNPDGALAYTRENANGIDLNRDAVALKAIESKLLRNVLDEFNPHFCFNLHDQRTIFNVEGTKNPATISFLAPSVDKTRTITKGRTETMSVIVAMNNLLQQLIPNQIGRYTDEFYPTATGDNFQKLGYNTILIEAGHFLEDYDREITRKYNFLALLEGLHFIATTKDFNNYKPYFNIPNNDKKYFDIIYRNTKIEENSAIQDVGVLFTYKLTANNTLKRVAIIGKTGDLTNYYGYIEINLRKERFNPLLLVNI